MEGERWTFDMSKKQTLGKKENKHWSDRREREDGWKKKKKKKSDDDDEGEDNFFSRESLSTLGVSSSSFFSFSSVVVVVVVVVVGLEANSFLVPRSKRTDAVTYKHTNTHISLSLSLRGR